MKRIIMIVVVFLLFAAAGVYERGTHGDAWKEYQQTGDCGEYKVNYVFTKKISSDGLDYERGYYETADIVAEAKMAEETSKQKRDGTEYILEIEKVWKGDSQLEGEQIQYEVICQTYAKRHQEIFNKFVNFMRPGQNYLVFLYKPNIAYERDNIYISHEHSSIPYFVIGETKNVFDEEEYKNLKHKNYYRTVEHNEFFVKNQEALDILLDFKQEIMDTYMVK